MIKPVDTIVGKMLFVHGNSKINPRVFTPGGVIWCEWYEPITYKFLLPEPLNLKPLPEGLF